MALFRFALALVVLAASSPALAEEPSAKPNTWPSVDVELPPALCVPSSMMGSLGVAPGETPRATKRKSSSSCSQTGCGYKAILSGLVITRDIQASSDVSVRVLPTPHALGGEDATTPILLRPRVEGSGRYSLNLRATF